VTRGVSPGVMRHLAVVASVLLHVTVLAALTGAAWKPPRRAQEPDTVVDARVQPPAPIEVLLIVAAHATSSEGVPRDGGHSRHGAQPGL